VSAEFEFSAPVSAVLGEPALVYLVMALSS
jgi:hypothetical protein